MSKDLTDSRRTEQIVRASEYPQGPARKLKADENDIFNGTDCGIPCGLTFDTDYCTMSLTDASEVRNERALAVYNRVQHKLSGSLCSS